MNHAKMKLTTQLIVLAAAIALSSTAFASGKKHDKGRHGDRAFAEQSIYGYGKVLDVTPIYREVRVSTPRKECWDEPVRVTRRHRNDSAAGTLAGALIGGVLGHQIGKGRGNKAATALGTVIGAQMGHDANRRHDSYDSYTRYKEVCEVTEQVNYQEVIEGYRVTYRYKGKRFHTRMPYDPGDKIKLKISVEPVF